ncbi:MAG: hypothetical protein IKO41_02225, partial [Lachnospiraceae bacterium]|nr:hypothetical protein [Lachnospiraceae bacterium]
LKEKGVPFAHYVYPTGGHGLSVASMEQFMGWHGGEYVCEQLGFALEHVKNDTAVGMNPQRKEELMQQFFAPKEPPKKAPEDDNPPAPNEFMKKLQAGINPFADVNTWVELSRIWFERLPG